MEEISSIALDVEFHLKADLGLKGWDLEVPAQHPLLHRHCFPEIFCGHRIALFHHDWFSVVSHSPIQQKILPPSTHFPPMIWIVTHSFGRVANGSSAPS